MTKYWNHVPPPPPSPQAELGRTTTRANTLAFVLIGGHSHFLYHIPSITHKLTSLRNTHLCFLSYTMLQMKPSNRTYVSLDLHYFFQFLSSHENWGGYREFAIIMWHDWIMWPPLQKNRLVQIIVHSLFSIDHTFKGDLLERVNKWDFEFALVNIVRLSVGSYFILKSLKKTSSQILSQNSKSTDFTQRLLNSTCKKSQRKLTSIFIGYIK